MEPLALREKEYRQSLHRTERRAIIPLKWFVLAATAGLWFMVIEPSGTGAGRSTIFTLFGLYAAFNLFESYCFYLHGVGSDWVKPLTLISYLVDVVFVAMLIYLDTATLVFGTTPNPSFYILLFLLVMRGFALFSTLIETILVNLMISLLFILILWLQDRTFSFARSPEFVVQLVLVWLVVLMGWFIMVVINQQKLDLIRTHEQLLRAESLARVGELAAGVAHEINNPLGIIIANTEYLKKGLPEGDERAEELEAIYRESNRCKEIVQQLLTYANPKPGGVTVVDPAALNDEVLQFVFPKGRIGELEVVREYENDLPSIRADPNLLKQALLNLYLNAKQALPADAPGKIVARISGRRRGGVLTFEIVDNGIGVDTADLEHVFDPFFTRKPQGSGLGLSVTQRIVELFGGSISLEPAEPSGTRVRMEFPAAEA